MKIKKHPHLRVKFLTEAAKFFGFGFFLLGAAGFAPFLAVQGRLFDIFAVSPAQNFFHMMVGTAALLASSTGPFTSRFLFQILSVMFAAIASLDYLNAVNGFEVFGGLAGNGASFLLHGAAALASAALGFTDEMEHHPSKHYRPITSAVTAMSPKRHRRRPVHTTPAPEHETLIGRAA